MFLPFLLFFLLNFDTLGNGKNAEKSSETTRRSQADVKSVEAALHLQSQKSIQQCEVTDESNTLTMTEDEINNDTKRNEEQSEQSQWVMVVRIISVVILLVNISSNDSHFNVVLNV